MFYLNNRILKFYTILPIVLVFLLLSASCKKSTKVEFIQEGQDIETSIAEQGSTLWALFNGVTRYTNHSTSSKDVDYGLMFGTEAKINERAYNTMLRWLNKEELV